MPLFNNTVFLTSLFQGGVEEEDDYVENWPPWVTKNTADGNGISDIDSNNVGGTTGEDKSIDSDISSRSSSSSGVKSAGLSTNLKGRAIFYYLVPVFIVWIGSVIAQYHPPINGSPISHSIS